MIHSFDIRVDLFNQIANSKVSHYIVLVQILGFPASQFFMKRVVKLVDGKQILKGPE